LKEFSQKSHYTKHQNKKIPCQDNKGKIEDVVENIIINKKLISNNTENININTNTMEAKSKKQKNEDRDKLMIEVEKQSLEDLKTDSITLLHGDCLQRMKEIPDNSVDLILCDLPYGTTKCKWDTIIDIDTLWVEYKRIIKKPSGVILLFGQQPFTSRLVSSNYEWFKYNIIWKKNKTTQFLLANYRPMKCTEDICVFSQGGAAAASKHKGNMTYNPQGLKPVNIKKKNSKERIGKMLNQSHHLGPNNKLTSNTEYSQKFTNYPIELIEFDIEYDTIHETQKPVKLIEYLIKTYSNEKETVLDNTMGSGTTGIGCINTNRKFIGIELNDLYYRLSKYRIFIS
jgi:site-specific DNA-methyltransferase (adenine-specific)